MIKKMNISISTPSLVRYAAFVFLLAGSFLLMNPVQTAIAATHKAVVINISENLGEDATNSEWIQNGAKRVAGVFHDNHEYTLEYIADQEGINLERIQSAIAGKTGGSEKYGALIVYLSGFVVPVRHGNNVELSFVLSNYDSGNPDQGTISLREICAILSQSPASTKLLVLDTFPIDPSNDANRVASDSFRGFGNLYLMASSDNGFCGHFLVEQKMSLFAYWFAEAIQGSANRSLSGKVSLAELHDYMSMCVNKLAEAMGIPQNIFAWQLKSSGTPVLISKNDKNSPVIITPIPEKQSDSIYRIAGQMATMIHCYGMNRVAVSEFTLAEGNKLKMAKPAFMETPMIMAKDMERRLVSNKLSPNRYVIMPTDQLQEKMSLAKIEPETLLSEKSKETLGRIMVDGKPLSSIIVGFFKKPNSLSFTCGLVDVATMKPLLVTSSIVKTEPRDFDGDKAFSSNYPVDIQVKNRQGEYEDREIHFIGGRAFVELQKNEVYQVVVRNFTNDTVGFRVLVDGMNTHPERETTIVPGKELPKEFSTAKSRVGKLVAQKQVPLHEANFWVLKPTIKRADGTQTTGARIKGFYESLGENSTYHEFVVTDAADSEAAKSGYTNELGSITVGVYSLRSQTRAEPDRGVVSAELGELGTKKGNAGQDQEIKVFSGMEIDETKSLVYIRYVTPAHLQLLLRENQK